MTRVDAMLERLRPHVERYLSDGDCTGFEITGRLQSCEGDWKVASKGAWDDEVIRTLRKRPRQLTAVT